MSHRFLAPARDELAEAVEVYNDRRPGLGGDLATEVEHAISRIEQFPLASPSFSETIRRCRVFRFPYNVLYQIRDDEILVVAVMHLRRKPGLLAEPREESIRQASRSSCDPPQG